MFAHRGEAGGGGADRLDLVVAVRFEAVEEKNFLELDGVGGVGRVDDDGVPAKIFDGANVGLSEEFVG